MTYVWIQTFIYILKRIRTTHALKTKQRRGKGSSFSLLYLFFTPRLKASHDHYRQFWRGFVGAVWNFVVVTGLLSVVLVISNENILFRKIYEGTYFRQVHTSKKCTERSASTL